MDDERTEMNIFPPRIADMCTRADIIISICRDMANKIYEYRLAVFDNVSWPAVDIRCAALVDEPSIHRMIEYRVYINGFIRNLKSDVKELEQWKAQSVINELNTAVIRTIDNINKFIEEYTRNMEYIDRNWKIGSDDI